MWGGFIYHILAPILFVVALMLVVRFITRKYKWSGAAALLAFCLGIIGWMQLIYMGVL